MKTGTTVNIDNEESEGFISVSSAAVSFSVPHTLSLSLALLQYFRQVS